MTNASPRKRNRSGWAAWAGLQDSVPRAALLSIHARVERTSSSTLGASVPCPALGPAVQRLRRRVGGPSVFSLGRLPDDARGRRGPAILRTGSMRSSMAGGCPSAKQGERWASQPNSLRYAAPTGTSPPALGRLTPACRLDRASARHGPAARASRTRAPVPPRLWSGHSRVFRPLGRDSSERRRAPSLRRSPRADAGEHTVQ